MALKKLMVISKEGYLLLLDFDDEDDDIKVSEEALAEGIAFPVLIVSCSSLEFTYSPEMKEVLLSLHILHF
jgi:hypothetical protein